MNSTTIQIETTAGTPHTVFNCAHIGKITSEINYKTKCFRVISSGPSPDVDNTVILVSDDAGQVKLFMKTLSIAIKQGGGRIVVRGDESYLSGKDGVLFNVDYEYG